MLIEKPSVSVDDIVAIKMSNSDEIIAKVSAISSTEITVLKPMTLNIVRDQSTGQPALSMVPIWMFGSDANSKFNLNLAHVMCMVVANKDVKANYIQQTSGLLVPGGPNNGGLIL
jgi:hypothetical protein